MVIEPLGRQHDRTSFVCGEPALDDFLKKLAWQQQEKNVSKTFVVVPEGGTKVLGFYTLSAGSIQFASLPLRIRRKLPKYPVPVVLLGRLAVDASMREKGVGKALLRDALVRVASVAATDIGVVAVVVDAKNKEAATFYERYGFEPLEDRPRTLFLLTKDLLAALSS